MIFKILVDENIPNSVIKQLRVRNFEILSNREENKGIKDEKIIKLSIDKQLPILTMDKDFGYLTFRQKLIPYGVILILELFSYCSFFLNFIPNTNKENE